ncbi:MAG: twin-arginine translocation signal domain-containing protein, partial [Methanosarcinales archaeon]|nr:twin-arginine translocation signal domain-containing protein [Methanosarcinales archaeon]
MENNIKGSQGYHMDRRTFLKLTGLTAGALALSNSKLVGHARALFPQTPLPGHKIPQFVDALPNLHAIVDSGVQIDLRMTEFQYNMMPTGFVPAVGTYSGTSVWGYLEAGQSIIPSYIGPVIVAARNSPTEIKWANNLGYADPILDTGSKVVAYTQSTDQTLHWADPLNTGMNIEHYAGYIPAVPHLHGGEVPPDLDGGPDAWFTSDGAHQGHAYHSKAGGGALGNEAIYRYPNSQEAANIWFHDHTLGATR